MKVSDYWYEKQEMPREAKEEIKKLVCGEEVATIEFAGHKTKLFRVNGKVFSAVFMANREYLYKGEFTAPAIENDYTESENYLLADGLAGVSISRDGWLVSLFSNCDKRGFAVAVAPYIKRGDKLQCIVTGREEKNPLVKLYKEYYGFRIVAATTDDTKIMTEHYGTEFMEAFIRNNGVPYHVFMVRGEWKGKNKAIVFGDYYDAKNYVKRIKGD